MELTFLELIRLDNCLKADLERRENHEFTNLWQREIDMNKALIQRISKELNNNSQLQPL